VNLYVTSNNILMFRLVSCSSSLLFPNIVFFSVFTPLNPEFLPNDIAARSSVPTSQRTRCLRYNNHPFNLL